MGGSSSKQTVGYKYSIGSHWRLCYGPIDKITRIRFDDKTAWEGISTGGRININAPNLFGGEEREGGVVGAIDLEMGESSQGRNSYLASKLGSLVPAFRGLCTLVMRQVYMGMNPYLKPFDVRAQRIHKGYDGGVQWYDAKAEVYTETDEAVSYFKGDIDATSSGGQVTNNVHVLPSNPISVHVPLGSRVRVRYNPAGKYDAVLVWEQVDLQQNRGWQTLFSVMPEGGSGQTYTFHPYGSVYATADEAAENSTLEFVFEGSERYYFYFFDEQVEDNQGGTSFEVFVETSYGAMNPAHMIRECLLSPVYGLGASVADLTDEAFVASADRLYSEGFGLSCFWQRQGPVEDFIKDILRHIDGVLYVDPATGRYVLKLIRDDYSAESLLELDETNILEVSDFSRPSVGELINHVTLKWRDIRNTRDAAISAQDIALIQQQGGVVAETVDMPMIRQAKLASRVLQRELKQLSAGLAGATVIAGRDAAGLRIGEPFKLSWSKYGISGMVMRVTNISYGTHADGRVKIDCTQDVFGLPDAVYASPPESGWSSPVSEPVPMQHQLMIEAPYWQLIQEQGESFVVDETDSYALVAGPSPTDDSLSARMWTHAGGEYADRAPLEFCPYAELRDYVPKAVNGALVESFILVNGVDLEDVEPATVVQINDECMNVVSLTGGRLTVERGVIDTPPQDHPAGSGVFFWGISSASDEVLYTESETVYSKLTPSTGAGALPLDDAVEMSVTMAARANRPYPPANVTIDAEYFPDVVEGGSAFDLAWAHRDRTLQTAGLVDFTDASIGPEVGTSYDIELVRNDTGAVLDSYSALTGVSQAMTPGFEGDVTLTMTASRGGEDSFLAVNHSFFFSATDEALLAEPGSALHSEDNETLLIEG